MTTELVSHGTFKWILTILTLAACFWALFDIYFIARLVRARADTRDPLVRDKYFGYTMGIALGLLGIAGVLRFHDVL